MPGRRPRFDESGLRAAIAASRSWAETLRKLGYCPTGGNPGTVKKYAAKWSISTEHFDPDAARHRGFRRKPFPLEEVLVRDSTYGRHLVKKRLFAEGLKSRNCEMCGQGEIWRGRRMSLILDHVNGVSNDHRLGNLRILCPNCAATLETHCARKLRRPPLIKTCPGCGQRFEAERPARKYCSRECVRRTRGPGGVPGVGRPQTRKVARPPYRQLVEEIERTSYVAVGRRYGVSDNAVRKWIRQYERERQARGEREAA